MEEKAVIEEMHKLLNSCSWLPPLSLFSRLMEERDRFIDRALSMTGLRLM